MPFYYLFIFLLKDRGRPKLGNNNVNNNNLKKSLKLGSSATHNTWDTNHNQFQTEN